VLKVGDVSELRVGAVVRALRKERGHTLAEVGAASGLSVPFLSQIENDRSAPSMRSLQALAAALGTTAVALLSAAEESARVDVVRADENRMPEGGEGRVRSVVRGNRQLHALEFEGTTDRGAREFVHANDELLYVVRGSALVWAGDDEYEVAEGDTLYWAGGVPHRWKALEPDTKVLLVAVNELARLTLSAAKPEERP